MECPQGQGTCPPTSLGDREREEVAVAAKQAQMNYYHRDASCSSLPCDWKRIRCVKAEQQPQTSSATVPHHG